MDPNVKKAWKHLLINLELSMTDIAKELGVTTQAVYFGLNTNGSKPVQRFVLQLAKQKGIPIPQELSTII